MPKRAKRPPKVWPTIEKSKFKRRTGFASYVDMISYIITVCNGDFNRIRRRNLSMTRFEECFLFLEWSYGQTCARKINIIKVWDMHVPGINEIKDGKLTLKVASLQSWPQFASFK